nr:unnamed protein product [Digitaria exilis]
MLGCGCCISPCSRGGFSRCGRYASAQIHPRDAYVVGEDFGSLGPVGREPFVVDDKDLESDEALWALYERWCKFWGEERSHEEMQRRFGKFKRSVLFVDHFNKKAIRDGNSCRLEVNMFSDEKLQEERLMHLPMTILDRLPYSKSPIFGRAGHRPFSEGTEEVDLTEGSEEVDFTKGFK